MRLDGKHDLWDPTSKIAINSNMPVDSEADELEFDESADENNPKSKC